ncbi:MAG: hypothetical protein ACREBJ_00170 [Nitrosotalea sp.]
MTLDRNAQLAQKMLVCSYAARGLLDKIRSLEANTQVSQEEKFFQIKKINEEITKVGAEIDSIKGELTLLSSYSIN